MLTTLDAGESTELEYAVQLPADFENAFSLEADLMTWKLKAEPNRAVQTGDDFPFYGLSAILIGAGAGILLLSRKGRKEEETNETGDSFR